MRLFGRIFKYVWPQWPRLVIVVATAFLLAILFSLSFATIIPLLKVMTGEEGLHGWIDRETCKLRYGMDFYVPDIKGTIYHLRVIRIKEGNLANQAGLKQEDQIIGSGSNLTNQDPENIAAAKLLEELATSTDKSITIQLRRFNEQTGKLEPKQIQLNTSPKDIHSLDRAKSALVDWIQWAASFMPRQETEDDKQQAVMMIVLVMIIVTIVRCICKFYQQYMGAKIVQIAITKLREEVFDHVLTMPFGFFSSKGTSDTTSRLLGDTAATGKGIKLLLGKTLREPLTAITTLSCAMLISVKLTLIFLCAAPLTVGLLSWLGKKIKKATKHSLISTAIMLGKVEETMESLCVVKVYNRQDHESSAFRAINRKFLRQTLRMAKVGAGTSPVMEVLGMIAGSAALLVGIRWVFDPDINMQPSMFFGLIIFLGTAAESVRKLSDVWNDTQEALAASERVFAIIDHPSESEKTDAVEMPPLKYKIEFKDIIFTYPGNNEPTLNRVNLTVKAGQNIAIVGPNGSGKTTLMNLVPRFYDVDSGSVMIDDTDVRDATLRSLRNQIGLVTQSVVTFNDTVFTNIAYGNPNATKEEIIEAAKRSFVHEFIEPLPEGYDTVIGEHGSGFSGGQLQRIVIARAILKNPPILIFDEATSQVDADSESKIHKALTELMHDRTCFIIAHRFSTVISADTIVVMDNGQIVAEGTHEYLIQNCSLYQNLYRTQLVASESE